MKTTHTKYCSQIAESELQKFLALNSANRRQHFRSWVDKDNAVAQMIVVWIKYADCHADRFKSMIGDDYVLGKYWLDAGIAIRGMLNGELGGLDVGCMDATIHACLIANGFAEGLDW